MLAPTDERDEELASIAAIYPELDLDAQDPHRASLEVDVIPSSPLRVSFCPSDPVADGEHDPSEVRPWRVIQYFPPLRMEIALPAGYPDTVPPSARLTSRFDWLDPRTLARLQDKLRDLWEEYGQSQVVFAFIDFLQTEAERLFGLGDVAGAGNPLVLDSTIEDRLVGYNQQKARDEFNKGSYSCGICLDPKPGSLCHQMHRCAHVFCVSCLQDFYRSAIAEGTVTDVKCLDPDCGLEGLSVEQRRGKKRPTLHPRELLEIPLAREEVQRYVKMKLKKQVESDKNTVYCPRSWCQAPAKVQKYAKYRTEDLENYPDESDSDEESPADATSGDRLSQCSSCAYAFCSRCRRTWHGEHVACRVHADTVAELSAEEQASEEWVRMYTSPCPTCDTPAQKTSGCNHMICPKCQTHFCYLCSAWLAGDNPYKHFNTRGKFCFERLFDLAEGDRGDQMDAAQRVAFGGARGFEIDHVVVNHQHAAAAAAAPGPPAAPAGAHAAIAQEAAAHPIRYADA